MLAVNSCHTYYNALPVSRGIAPAVRGPVWRFTNKAGARATVTPLGPLRVTNVDALLPTLLAGVAIAEMPEFIAFDLLRTGQVEALLPGWGMALGGLNFVTPTTRARSAKVGGDILISDGAPVFARLAGRSD